MPPRDAILEQALAELAELSRRVADLTATVSALASSSNPSHEERAPHDIKASVSGVPAAMPAPTPTAGTGGLPAPSAMPTSWPAALPPWAVWGMPPMLPPTAWPMPAPAPQSPAPEEAVVASESASFTDAPIVPLTKPLRSTTRRSQRKRAPSREDKRARSAPSFTPKASSKRSTAACPEDKPSPENKKTPASQRGATSVSKQTASAGHTTPQRNDQTGRGRRRIGSLLVSTTVHAIALVLLAVVFVTREAEPEPLMLTASVSPVEPLNDVTEVQIEPMEPTEPLPELEPEPLLPDLADLEPLPPTFDDLSSATDLPSVETVSLVDVGLATGPTTADLSMPLEGSGSGTGGGRSGSGHTAGMPAGGSLFFGTPGAGNTICFMCDNSRSYEPGGFEMVVEELMRSVASLSEKQSFFVVFFSDQAYPMFYPSVTEELVPATEENKRRFNMWLTNVEKRTGGQGLRDALELVESLQPASICFLSDGDHSESLVERLVAADLGQAVLNTFGMQTYSTLRTTVSQEQLWKQQRFNQNLARIAAAHGGVFTPVAAVR
jgi:hypothetical protein